MRDLIVHENENTGLDFKATQYSRAQYAELLQDVIAMANSDWQGNRYIVVGVKDVPGKPRQFLGIHEQLTDQATLQQLTHENVEPDLSLSYTTFNHQGVLLGVISIQADLHKRPFLMKKDFLKDQALLLRRGDGFVRTGTHKRRLERRDHEKFYAARYKHSGFAGELFISFAGSGGMQSIALPCIGHAPLPSERIAAKIQAILDERQSLRDRQEAERLQREEDERRLAASNPLGASFARMLADMELATLYGGLDLSGMNILPALRLGPNPYEERPDEELLRNLESVSETYEQDDCYELFEERSARVNFEIENRGDEYVEDTSLRVTIDTQRGDLMVIEEPCEKPVGGPFAVPPLNLNRLHYPDVSLIGETYVVTEAIGQLKHGLTTRAFAIDLRVVLSNQLAGTRIPFTVEVFGKNLPRPIAANLSVDVVSCDEESHVES